MGRRGLGENFSLISCTPDELEVNDLCGNGFSGPVVCLDIVLLIESAFKADGADHHTLVISIHDGGMVTLDS